MIRFSHKGDFKKTEKLFAMAAKVTPRAVMERFGKAGVDALAAATPTDTGKTASSWGYEIVEDKNSISLFWTNSNVNNGCNIAVILQYGHGTRNGGYVAGRDYINPAIRPIFDRIAQDAWEEVKHI